MVDRVKRVDTQGMHSVLAFAFQGHNDPREDLPNGHYNRTLNRLVGEGKLVVVTSTREKDVFHNKRKGAYVVYTSKRNKTGLREEIDVRACGDPVKAIGRAYDFAMNLLGQCCSGYSGRS